MVQNNKWKKIVSILLLLIMAAAVTGCRDHIDEDMADGSAGIPQEDREAAPNFEAELAGGGTFILSDAVGEVTIINFWATWCPPCCEEMPAFEKLHKEYGDQLNIIAVDYGENREVVDAFIEENGYTFPIAYDEAGSISSLYPSNGIPYTLIIDKEGNVFDTFEGAYDAETQYELYKSAVEVVMNE